MFKALLKTLPSLSGNMKLSCFVDNYAQYKENNKRHSNKYTCEIKNAKLLPISHTLFDKNIYVNLKNNAYEYDVKHFYKYYLDVFYKSNFSYSKLNTPIINFTNYLYDCNEDFYFGCKRISYEKYGNQLGFFAPIYIESADDLKGKYFKITCIFENVGKVKKELIINISENNNENYLADYLRRYAEKIDDKVIYMSSTYKNMYYGIDLLHGGFIRVEDNISNNLYNKYYTINDFDAIINYGFRRNNMMMKQIIPLSFYFNPQELLTNYEKTIYKDAKISIYGSWYTNGVEEDFYNFSDNYNYYNESTYQLLSNNVFSFTNNVNNIMNLPYPAFNESMSENYKYINTIIKTYNRWKLKYSNDDYPYIINNNFAFSSNQNSLYSYKEFPLMYNAKSAVCKFKGENYNMLFDLKDIYDQSGKLLNVKEEYYDLFNKNYIANFYNLLIKKNDNTYDDIFANNDNWGDVNKDNKLYYKGILYDLNIIYAKYKDMPKIDKFGIFVNPEMMSSISNIEYNTTYNSVKYTLNENEEINNIVSSNSSYYILDKISNKIYTNEFITNNSSYIVNNNVVYHNCSTQDNSGDYVDINGYYINSGLDLSNLHYNNKIYIDISEALMYATLYDDNIYNKIYNNNIDIISGYKVIDVKYKNNIVSDLYGELFTLYNQNRVNFGNLIFSKNRFLENDDIYWAIDKLYFSIYPHKTKYPLLSNSELLNSLEDNSKIIVYFSTSFILFDSLISLCEDEEHFNEYKDKLNKYYITNTLYDKNDKQSYSDKCFVRISDKENDYGKYSLYDFNNINNVNEDNTLNNFHENVLFIDTFNLNNFYKTFFEDEDFSFYKVKDCYCNFLNIEHIHKYCEKLYKDENLKSDLTNTNVIDNIYIKIRTFNNIVIDNDKDDSEELNFVNTTTKYIKLINFFYFTENISLNELLDYIDYDDNGYFFFTNNYYHEINNARTNGLLPDEALPQIKNFEICFKKTMGIVNTQLYKLIMQMNSRNLFKDLYLYKMCDTNDYMFEYVMNDKYIYTTQDEEDIKKDISVILPTSEIELYPYFNSVYNEEKINTKIYNDSFLNNIVKCENVDLYKYNVYDIDYLVYLPKEKIDNSYLCAYRYSLYSKYDNSIINSYTFASQYIKPNSYSYSYMHCNNYGNMITYSYDNTIYGFYIIHTEFDNTSNTLNLISENFDKINVVSYINDIECNKIINNQYEYLSKYYHNIAPYIHNSNIVKELLNDVEVIITPNKYTLSNIYKQLPNKNLNDQIYSYNIIVNGNTNLQLLRYFDNIVPYLQKTNNITSYYLYYKNTDNFIENDLYNKNLAYIMYQKSNSIYDTKSISYFDNISEKNSKLSGLNLIVSNYTPTEYKNFNNNKFYNLETYFKVKLQSDNKENKYLFTKKEIDEIENNKDKIYNFFKEHIIFENKEFKANEIDILFLYKKYDVDFSHIIKSFHSNDKGERDYDLYSLTIKYKLL